MIGLLIGQFIRVFPIYDAFVWEIIAINLIILMIVGTFLLIPAGTFMIGAPARLEPMGQCNTQKRDELGYYDSVTDRFYNSREECLKQSVHWIPTF